MLDVPTSYAAPSRTVALTNPSGSSVESSVEVIVNVKLPDAGIVTVRKPLATPKSPLFPMINDTLRLAAGAGLAVNVNVAPAPSVTLPPAAMLTTGVGGSSSSDTVTVADLDVPRS